MARARESQAPPPTAPADDTPARITPCSLVPKPDTPLQGCPTNLDLTTRRGKAMAVAAGSPGDIEFDPNGTARIDAVAYLLMPEERISAETGELVQLCRTVLFGRDGKTWRSTSESAPHALHRILQLYSAEEWAAGIPIVVSERRSRKTGRTYHDLRVVME